MPKFARNVRTLALPNRRDGRSSVPDEALQVSRPRGTSEDEGRQRQRTRAFRFRRSGSSRPGNVVHVRVHCREPILPCKLRCF